MKADIGTGQKQEIMMLSIVRLDADIVLGIQRGIDVHISFLTEENTKLLPNYRVIHFKGVHSSIWNEKKAEKKIIEYIEAGNKLVSNQKYNLNENGEV